MSQHTDLPETEKVLEALELCAHPITVEQIETLAGCRNLQTVMEYLVDSKLVIVSTHSVVTTSGQTKDEQRYQIGSLWD